MRITEVVAKDGYILHIKADDGREGLFDVSPYLISEVFAPLTNRNEFERIHNGSYFISWACGADLSADTLEAKWKPFSSGGAAARNEALATTSRG